VTLPLGWFSYREALRKTAAAATAAGAPAPAARAGEGMQPSPPLAAEPPTERPTRLN
jgi:hypothetical protein